MACFLGNLPLRPVPYRFSIRVLLPMIICSMLSCSYLKSCQCYCPTRCYYSTNQRINCSYSSFEEMQLYLYSTDLLNYTSEAPVTDCGADLFGYVKKSYPGFNFSSTGMLVPYFPVQTPLWINTLDGRLLEASFDLSFTMGIDGSAGQSNLGMLLAILSSPSSNSSSSISIPNGSVARDSPTPIAGGSKVSVQVSPVPSNITIIRQLPGLPSYYDNSIGINISVTPPQISIGTNNNSYNVSVKYDSDEHQLSVSVVDARYGAGGNQRDSPILYINNFNLSSITNPNPTFGFLSTVEQLQRLNTLDTSFQYLFPEYGCPKSRNNAGSPGVNTITPAVIGSSVVVASIVVAAHCYINSKYRKWKKDLDRLAKTIKGVPGVPKKVEYADIKRATNDFHESMEIGRGGFGAVYRCRLPASITGDEVAVKKFMRHDNDHRYEDFLAEVSIINRLRHKNIVPLIGWSYHKGEALLIYEYMSNGSLDKHLFRNGRITLQQENTAVLPWKTRYDIVRDIATGLNYIHHEHEPLVLHRDIKASNIMLDSNLRARLGDFGIACTVDLNKNWVSFGGKILGTWGYIAPEYAKSCKATRESDIYAFGVLLLEIVTGRHQLDDAKRDGDDDITDWILRLHRQGKLLQTVDDNVLTVGEDDNSQAIIADEAAHMLLLGLACTHPNPASRPSIVDVLQVITKSAPPPDVSPDRSISLWLPTQDLHSRNTFYSTAASRLDAAGSSGMMELVVHDSEEQPVSEDDRGHVSLIA